MLRDGVTLYPLHLLRIAVEGLVQPQYLFMDQRLVRRILGAPMFGVD